MTTQIKELLNKFKGYLFVSDKWLHLSAGLFIAFWVGLFNPFIGLGLAILAGVAKEVYDKVSEKGTPDVWDLVFTIIGALLGFANIFLMRLVNWLIW